MLKEIFEQPRAVADSLLGRTRHRRSDPARRDAPVRPGLRDIDKIIIIACGTSFHAGLVAKYAIEHWCRIPVEVEFASEFRYRDPILTASTLVVAISQSGETADTLQAMRHAREQRLEGARDLQHQRLDHPARVRRRDLHPRRPRDRRRVDQGVPHPARRLLPPRALPRAGQGHPLRRRDRPGHGPARRDARRTSRRCSARPRRSARSPATTSDSRSVLFLGRHVGYPVALEGALKLKEIAYIHAEGFAGRRAQARADRARRAGLPIVVRRAAPQGARSLHDKMLSDIQEIRARGARTIVLAEEGDATIDAVRRRTSSAAAGADAAPAARGRRAAAGPGVRAGHAPAVTTSTSPATSPSPSRSNSAGHRRRHRRRRHRALRGDARSAGPRCAGGCSPTPSRR